MKCNIKKGFTVAEQVVVLMALGVIFAIMIPTARYIFPDRDKALFKKAYLLAKRNVEEMIENDTMYPDHDIGFADTSQIFEGGYSGTGKFRNNFMSYFMNANTKECRIFTVGVEDSFESSDNCFTTNENITWGIPDDDFSDNEIYITIYSNLNDNELRQGNTNKAFILKVDNKGRISIPPDDEIDCPNDNLKRCKAKEFLRSGNIKKDL